MAEKCTITKDDLDFHKNWSSVGGENAAWKDMIAMVEQAAAQAFISRKDEIANYLRDLIKVMREKQTRISNRLQEYIDKAREH